MGASDYTSTRRRNLTSAFGQVLLCNAQHVGNLTQHIFEEVERVHHRHTGNKPMQEPHPCGAFSGMLSPVHVLRLVQNPFLRRSRLVILSL
jgi:hypothetical protein